MARKLSVPPPDDPGFGQLDLSRSTGDATVGFDDAAITRQRSVRAEIGSDRWQAMSELRPDGLKLLADTGRKPR
jgi:hypothetical protein